ncbi:Dihydropteroate synthase [Nitratireductor aquibiodomus]|jgi:dihydropteroate synthase|uniref:Dihydropteroate synthase n=1 Tax=Nitratireductor aquibiodomus TaxID=204799 RepID=A0A1H4ITZ9_9HYPH|nr:dihydropteroate synthase [Nitratireductor aquibiodomus]SEB37483.1 Dihydropteroate synthase [Nitratireductor aquibiodomus]
MTFPVWKLAHGRELALGPDAIIMGILNVTPDSFSDGGAFVGVESALRQADRLIGEGACIVDIGGESTRPGGAPVSAAEEQDRILPVFEALAGRDDVLLSVDTYRAETARLAVAAGAHIVNDVWGLQREPGIAEVASQSGAGLVIMHTGREREKLSDVIADQFSFLRRSLEIARHAGVRDEQILLDPGFGFAKDTQENIEIMARFEELAGLAFPLLVGTSRKRFVGAVTGRESAEDRDMGTAATSALLRMKGAAVFRVHDVAINRDSLKVADAMLAAQR